MEDAAGAGVSSSAAGALLSEGASTGAAPEPPDEAGAALPRGAVGVPGMKVQTGGYCSEKGKALR
eukprot:9200028-Heterocapsa_arctica.AAC.1